MQKLNNNIHYAVTTEMNSNNMLLHSRTARHLTLSNTISYLQSEKSPFCDMASEQSILERGGLCSLESPSAVSVLR